MAKVKSEAKPSAWERQLLGTEPQFATEEIALGPWSSYSMKHDPKHLCFVLSRYKFCAKMLEGKDQVIEVGCGDGIGIPIVAQVVKRLICLDWEPRNIEGCARRLSHLKNVTYELVDLTRSALPLKADAAFSIDVIEHIEPKREDALMQNICRSLRPDGFLITGTPNVTASAYATGRSEIQHINLKSHQSLRELTARYFKNHFMFGMNDEVVHTGYAAMCHYLWGIGVGVRPEYLARG